MENPSVIIESLQRKIRVLKTALKSASIDGMKYRRTFKHTRQGVLMLDRQLFITEVNPALLGMSGLQKADLVGKRLEDFYDQSRIEFYSASRSHLSFESGAGATDGRRTPALFNRSALRNAGGRIIGYMILVNDLTELKQVQEELRKADRRYHSMFKCGSGHVPKHVFRRPHPAEPGLCQIWATTRPMSCWVKGRRRAALPRSGRSLEHHQSP